MRCRAIKGFGNGFLVWFVLVGVFGRGFRFLVGLAQGFLGRFLPSLCGLRVGIFGSLIGRIVLFNSSFLSFWGHGWSPLYFGGSGVLSQGADSLCVFLVCLDIPW